MAIYIVIYNISILVSSISQILLKKSARVDYENAIKEYLNFKVIFAYGLFFLSTLLTMLALKGIPLSFGALLESLGYIYVMILSRIFLSEKITLRKIIGITLIIIGIACYALL